MMTVHYRTIEGCSAGYYGLLGVLGLLVLASLVASYFMETIGHVITGMNNQIVWGTPHVFAVFLIVAASGALNRACRGYWRWHCSLADWPSWCSIWGARID
jgi:molybdopterin-containing oxidoreductase family membrane subunit